MDLELEVKGEKKEKESVFVTFNEYKMALKNARKKLEKEELKRKAFVKAFMVL